jgi:hypothetical protein
MTIHTVYKIVDVISNGRFGDVDDVNAAITNCSQTARELNVSCAEVARELEFWAQFEPICVQY